MSLLLLLGSAGGGAAAPTYATWNPDDNGYFPESLSNGNLTLTGLSWRLVRSTLSKESGEWSAEFTAGVSTGAALVGVCTGSANLASFIGSDAHGFGYYSANGNVLQSAGAVAALATWVAGDVIGIKFTPGGTIQFYKNGSAQGSPIDISALSGPIFVGCSCFSGADVITANFGATAMTYDYGAANTGLFE